jgi:hypothetical protein
MTSEVAGIVWTVHVPSEEVMTRIIGDLLAYGARATQDRDAATELDRLQYFEGKVDAVEFMLSRLTS